MCPGENMKKNRNILAVGCHPDDIEFMCSGTLKLLKDRGYRIYMGIIAKGDCGSAVYNLVDTTLIRRKEAKEAAKLIDAELIMMGESDLRIFFDDMTKMKVTELIRKTDPLIVFTHPHEDYMEDHEVTSRLVRHACFSAPIPNYLTFDKNPAPPTRQIPYLYYFAPIDGKNIYGEFVPQRIYVNITDVVDFKADMLACHRSQKDWLFKQHGMDMYTENMKRTALLYGKDSGFKYAEGFTQHRGNAFPQNNILKEVLGDLLIEKE